MSTLKGYFDYIRANKWRLRLFSICVGVIFGASYSLIQPTNPLGIYGNFALTSLSMMYILQLFLGGHTRQIESILPRLSKKLVSFKGFRVWLISFFGWITIVSLVFLYSHSISVALVLLFSMIGFVTVYPCIVSLAIFIPSFRYLRAVTNEAEKKKNILKSMTIATVGLATPWLLFMYFIFAFLLLPIWANYIALTFYIAILFLTIYFPYYQSLEDVKKRKIKSLENVRAKIVENLCDERQMAQRLAIEFNVQRIDRDIEGIYAPHNLTHH